MPTNTTPCTTPSGLRVKRLTKSRANHSAIFMLPIPMPARLRTPTKLSIRDTGRLKKSPAQRLEMKRRRKKLEKGKEARRRARKSGLAPGVTRIIEDKRKKLEKHKKDLLRE